MAKPKKKGLPTELVIIIIACCLVFLAIVYYCVRRWCKRREKARDAKRRFKGEARMESVEALDGEFYVPQNHLLPRSRSIMAHNKSATSSGLHPVTGDILLRMTYERCALTLQVPKARNLKAGFCDPYCKVRVVPRQSEYALRTRFIQHTLSPEWKEAFTFMAIEPTEIHDKKVVISVWDRNRLWADTFLGEVIADLTDPTHLDGIRRCYQLAERCAVETR